MSTENKNAVAEKELSDSDEDGFEVLDPEPEQEAEDFKHLSRNDFTNAGTIIFCHMEDEYNNIQQVSCQYIRPEGWNEQEKDEIAIFEVGWINTDEAIAKLPVDRNISKGYPLGSVDLTEFAFCKEEYVPYPEEVSYFQFCYLRDGVLLGASTPFGIRGIKAASRLSLMGGKPLFSPLVETAANADIAITQSSPLINSMPVDSLELFETSAVKIPHSIHDKLCAENEAVHDETTRSAGVKLFELESSLRLITVLIKKLQNQECSDKTQTSETVTKMILKLTQRVDELKAEMQKARKGLPPNTEMTVTVSSPEFWEYLEQRFEDSSAQLIQNSQVFELCKTAMKNQTPPCSLSELEKSDYFRESEWKRQQELDELQKRLEEAEEQIEKLKRELHETSETLAWTEAGKHCIEEQYDDLLEDRRDVKKQLTDKETELQQVKEELSIKDNDLLKSKNMLCSVQDQMRVVREELSKKQSECQQLKESGEKLKELNYTLNMTIEEFTCKLENAEKVGILTEQNMKSQLEVMMKRVEDLNKELSLNILDHRHYVVEVSSERRELENKLQAVSDECGGLRSQITTLQEEAKLYKSKLGETIVELANSRREIDELKEQGKIMTNLLNALENERTRLLENIDTLKEKLETKRSDPAEHDVMVQEFLKKSEELLVAKQQVENFQDELSRLSVQRTTLQKELLEARQNPASCEKPCCTFEVDPGRIHTDSVVQSILEALEQSLQENKRLQSDLETEKKRSQSLDEKLQSAAGIQRGLYMEKITLESRLNELLGRD